MTGLPVKVILSKTSTVLLFARKKYDLSDACDRKTLQEKLKSERDGWFEINQAVQTVPWIEKYIVLIAIPFNSATWSNVLTLSIVLPHYENNALIDQYRSHICVLGIWYRGNVLEMQAPCITASFLKLGSFPTCVCKTASSQRYHNKISWHIN